MAKQNLSIGNTANDGLGDSLRDGAIKLNSVIDEIYTALGNNTNLQVSVGSPVAGQVLRWNGSAFAESHFDALSADLNVKTFKIISESNGDITIQPNGTGDIKLWAGGTGDALTYIDGADGKLRYSNFVDDLADLPDAATHHGMFIHVHNEAHGYFAHSGAWTQLLDTGSSIGDMDDVDLTVGGGPADGQVLKWNTTNSKWEPANDENSGTGGGTTQNLFETIQADSGQTTASAATDILTIAGGTNITTSITGDTVTINMTGTLGDPDQNIFSTIGSDSGSKTANSTGTTINIVGGTGISTAINGDNLTVTNDSPNVVQEVYRTVSGDTGSTTAALSTSTLSIVGTGGVSTTVTSNTVTIGVDGLMPTGSSNDVLIYDDSDGWVTSESPTVGFDIINNGSTAYRFTGGGAVNTTDNPTLYVYRGFTYRFNNLASAHPFALRTTSGGSAVTQGVSGSQGGVQFWTVPQTLSAGTTYVYQCTLHSGMVGNLVVV